MNTAIAFEHFGTEGGQCCAATPCTARSSLHDRFGEGLVDTVEKNPCSLIGHAHVAGGGGDRAGITDAFKELRFAGADARSGLEYDADPDPSHPHQDRTF